MISDTFDAQPLGDYDACVIGSGQAGLSFALEFARAGRKVLVLESGGSDWEASQQELSNAEIVEPALHDSMAIAVSRQLGGTSNLWGARCVPMDPIDFVYRPAVAEGQWPFPLEELHPFYEQAVKYLSAGSAVFKAPIPGLKVDDPRVDYTQLERFSNAPAIQKAHAEELSRSTNIDIRLHSTVVDMSMEDGRIRDITVAKADGSRVTIQVPLVVIASGGLESTRQLLLLQRKHPHLFGGKDGPLGRYYMGHVIGEIADVTFSDALDPYYDFFIDDSGSYARRRLVPSDDEQLRDRLLNVAFWPVVPPVADPRHRSGILSMVYLAFAIGPLGRLLVAEAIRKRHVPPGGKIGPHILNIIKDLPWVALYIPQFFYKRYFASMRLPGFFLRNRGRRYGLSYHAEQSPHADSRVWLSDRKDRFGVPQLVIDYRFARVDAEAILRSHALIADWLKSNGLGTVEYRQPYEETVDAILDIASHGTHQIGTARMGVDRSTAVLDANLRTFDVQNLYIASSAAFPTSGQCGPTLTISALAVRLAQHLAAKPPAIRAEAPSGM